jgi:glycosyltransferase involved in cell wall biosynthesis
MLDGFSRKCIRVGGLRRTREVIRELDQFAPDAIYVHGYAERYLRQASRWAHKSAIAVMMTTDSELLHPRPWYSKAIKAYRIPAILRNIDMILSVGDLNEAYYRRYGMDQDRIRRVPFSIDSDRYKNCYEHRVTIRKSLRDSLGIPEEALVLLNVGKLIPRKNQADLLQAFAEILRSTSQPVVLLIVGDGPEKKNLELLGHNLGAAARMIGYIGIEKLPEYYLASDLYVHPASFDPHPLAVSEAIYCGLPVVVSNRVGSAGPTDDVQVGKNGWVYECGEIAALAKILGTLILDSDARSRASEHSRELGKLHAADRCGRLFVDAAIEAVARLRASQVG